MLMIVLPMIAVAWLGVLAVICGICRSAAAGDRVLARRDGPRPGRALRLVS